MRLIFIGKSGQYIAGVPARDLSSAEYKALPLELQELATRSGLYRIDKEKTEKPAPKAEE